MRISHKVVASALPCGRDSRVGRALASQSVSYGFKSQPRHTKDVKEWYLSMPRAEQRKGIHRSNNACRPKQWANPGYRNQ